MIGNAQLPIEDLVDVVDSYHAQIGETGALPAKKQTLSRILFVYGTTFSQRENCIIGKMQVEINYSVERQYLAEGVLAVEEDSPSCFLHRETFIKRKIPLNAVLSVEVERINNLKESLENIEHFAKIQMAGKAPDGKSLSAFSKNLQVQASKDQTDRRRILTQIFKQGLNLVVIGSVFDEDSDLKKRFPAGKHTSRVLFNTLAPIFNEGFEIGIQMDTSIFEYLKSKKAVFEVRHYIIDAEQRQAQHVSLSNHKSHSTVSQVSQHTDEQEEAELLKESDYIVLGQVRVPLLHLITKNNGIDGDFVIFDDYKQQMGTLKLRINLNHHTSKRPLYSETNKVAQTLTDEQALIGHRGTLIDRTVKVT